MNELLGSVRTSTEASRVLDASPEVISQKIEEMAAFQELVDDIDRIVPAQEKEKIELIRTDKEYGSKENGNRWKK